MERILLAVDGIKPSQRVCRFALELCTSLRAGLSILQVLDSHRYRECLEKLKNESQRVRRFVEGSMTAATFAEAGELGIAKKIMAQAKENADELLGEFKKAGVQCNLTVTSGQAGKEIVDYVNEHRDVVLTIYDASDEENLEPRSAFAKEVPRKIRNEVSVPLVVMQS
jgi:nucleotide-binding universal stress UspA family protein